MKSKDDRVDAVFQSWPEWKKQFTITKYSAGNGKSVPMKDTKASGVEHSKKGAVSTAK